MLVVNNMAEAADREMEVSKSEGTFEENKSFQERLNEMPVVVNNMSEAADREMEVSKSEGTFEENKSFQERLNEMPAYTMSLSQLQTFYTTLKDRNEVLKNAFDAGEEYMNKFVTVAKPVVWAATASALTVAKPVVGELKDPVCAIDNCASEALAKVQEKLPFVKQTPLEMAEAAKTSAQETVTYYLEKVKSSKIGQQASKQADNAVSFSELMVEICFPTDGSNPEDVKEVEKAEEDEDKGILIRAGNLKDRAFRRGTSKLMSYKPVMTTFDNVQFVQNQISDMTEKLRQGTNYITAQSVVARDTIISNCPEIKNALHDKVIEGSQLLSKNWDKVYTTTMYIPMKALQLTGEVYISAQEVVFAYTKAHSITEVPHAIAEMAESYYNTLKNEAPSAGEVKEKAIAFVLVPAQVVSEYLGAKKAIQWIMPDTIETECLQVLEPVQEEMLLLSRLPEETLPITEF